MAFIRPEVRQWLSRWSEALIAAGVLLVGLWLMLRGGWFFGVVGLLALLVGGALLMGAWQRMPFRRQITAPGVVEVEEGPSDITGRPLWVDRLPCAT